MTFTPVACTRCSQLFQVARSTLGQQVVCPWCGHSGPALPVVTTVGPSPVGSLPGEPLSLDDATPPAPPVSQPTGTAAPDGAASASSQATSCEATPAPPVVSSPPTSVPRRGWWTLFVGLGLTLAAFLLAFFAVRYGSGWVPEWAWGEFAPPDGFCRVQMPALPSREEEYSPIPDFRMTRPGKKYIARGWYSHVVTSIGWVEIEREPGHKLREDHGVPALDHLAGGEIARRKQELNATRVEQATVKRGDREGIEARYHTPAGLVVERIMLVTSLPQARLYVLSYSAPAWPEGDAPVNRFFHSFQVIP